MIDRELPIGLADDAFTPDGTLADDDLSLALAGILAELHAETRPARRFPKGDSPLYLRAALAERSAARRVTKGDSPLNVRFRF